MKPYLVQRLKKPYTGEVNTPLQALHKFGFSATGLGKEAREMIGEVCKFDYMGSSEYEWGAIPKALSQMVKNRSRLNQYTLKCHFTHKSYNHPTPVSGYREVFVICHTEDHTQIKEAILTLAKGEEHCKERTNFCGSLSEAEYDKDVVGWFDLDNHFMFFKDQEMFRKMTELFGMEAL